MKTNDQNQSNSNHVKGTLKQSQVNVPERNKNSTDKKAAYIKDMPPIDTSRHGIL